MLSKKSVLKNILKFTDKQKKQSRSSRPEVFLRKSVLKICCKFLGEHPCRSVISISLLCNFIEITLRHGRSPVNSPVNLTASDCRYFISLKTANIQKSEVFLFRISSGNVNTSVATCRYP